MRIREEIRGKIAIIIWILALLTLIFFAPGCSPQKRLDRLYKNHPYLFQRDTIRDTVVINKINTDTLFSTKYLTKYDTITLNNDRLTIKYVKVTGDSVWIYGECDSVLVPFEVPCDKAIVNKKGFFEQIEGMAMIFFFAFIVLIFLIKFSNGN